jgi:hypothetical protein
MSRLEGVSFYGNLVYGMDKSDQFDWMLWIPTFTELGWQAKLETSRLAALLKWLIDFLSYALIKDYLNSGVQMHGWTVERKLTTETLGVSCSPYYCSVQIDWIKVQLKETFL